MKDISQWLIANFLKGAAIVLPVVASIYVLVSTGRWLDNLVGLDTPGLGALVIVAAMITVGAFASNKLGAWMVNLLQRIMERLPGLKLIYGVFRDIAEALVGNNRQFDHPVVISLTEQGDVKTLGFLSMQERLDAVPGYVAVYMPQSFNVAGNLILVPEDRVERLDMDPARAMTLVFSAGVVQKSTTSSPKP